MKKKREIKAGIIVAVLLLAIGFAAVTTTLYINGKAIVKPNGDDFRNNVKFADASGDEPLISNSVGKTTGTVELNATKDVITFETPVMTEIGETTTVSYKVINKSQYIAALGKMKCKFAGAADSTKSEELTNDYIKIDSTNGFDGVKLNKNTTTSQYATVLVTLTKSYIGVEPTYNESGEVINDGNDPVTYQIECSMDAQAEEYSNTQLGE